MAKLSAEDQATLDRLTALRDAPDSDDDAIWVRNGDGHETRLTGARATAWLERNGYSEAAGDASSQGAPLDPAAAGGKTAAKKAAPAAKKAAPAARGKAPAPDADIPGEDGEELDADPPARTGRRAFF